MCVSRSTDQHMKKRCPWQLMLTSFTYLFSSTCSRETHFKPYIAHMGCYTIYSIVFIWISLNIEEERLEREGNVAVYSLCVCAHMYACAHSLNKTKHRILKPSNLKDNSGKSRKLSWFKILWPSLCSSTALLEITFIAKKQAWLQGCLITHNDTKSIPIYSNI